MVCMFFASACFAASADEIRKDLEERAIQGEAEAQYKLGMMYAEGRGVKQNSVKAAELHEKAAVQGHTNAQYNIGVLYRNGQGVKQDYTKSLEWFKKAAAQGNTPAQYNLGNMYENGLGVKKDFTTAKEWYGLACNNKHQGGCTNYKRLNMKGQ